MRCCRFADRLAGSAVGARPLIRRKGLADGRDPVVRTAMPRPLGRWPAVLDRRSGPTRQLRPTAPATSNGWEIGPPLCGSGDEITESVAVSLTPMPDQAFPP